MTGGTICEINFCVSKKMHAWIGGLRELGSTGRHERRAREGRQRMHGLNKCAHGVLRPEQGQERDHG